MFNEVIICCIERDLLNWASVWTRTMVKLHWCIQLWEKLPEVFHPKQVFWTSLCLSKTVGIEYLTSFTSFLLLVVSKKIYFGKAEETRLSLFLLSSFSKQVTIRLTYSLSVCFNFFSRWSHMNLCVSLLVQNNCLRLEICNRKLKLKIWNSSGWELSKVSCQIYVHMKMSSDLPSGLSEFTMVAEMVFKVLFCAFGLISVYNSFSVQGETDNKISNSQPSTLVKGEPLPVRGVIWWGF